MDWEQARASTLDVWIGIRESIDDTAEADPVDLLSRINALNDMCAKAKEEAGVSWGHCIYCLGYQQFGGCKEVSGRISECVVAKDWEELTRLVDEFIAHLKEIRTPPPGVDVVAQGQTGGARAHRDDGPEGK